MSTSTTSSAHEVHLAIYDLSMGMARNLSSQFLGPQHAIEIIPHTAILAFGKEYYFGQGIDWCSPHEFRMSRNMHPVDIRPLGRTTCTETEFESWCRAQAATRFGSDAYDLFHRNCNNFSDAAARDGLRLPNGVPRWILDLPRKVLGSPMGVMLRPLLEQMQITNNAPTNIMPTGGGGGGGGNSGPMMRASRPTFAPGAPSSSTTATPMAVNPWADIPAAASPPKQTADARPIEAAANAKPVTPQLDAQTALLSTDTGVVKICVDRLTPPDQEHSRLLSKLSNVKASWTLEEIISVHEYLRSVIDDDDTPQQRASYALMLLRLAVLKRATGAGGEAQRAHSVQLVAKLLLGGGGKLPSMASRSMAWCVLSNAMGSAESSPGSVVFAGGTDDNYKLIQVVDRALCDCDPSMDGTSVSLRQSAGAFLYNTSRHFTLNSEGDGDAEGGGNAELSEEQTAILLGSIQHLQDETDGVCLQRLLMANGEMLKSRKFGKTAANLVNDLGMLDEEIGKGKSADVEALVKEVAALLRIARL